MDNSDRETLSVPAGDQRAENGEPKHTPLPWSAKRDDLVPERGAVYIEGPDGWDFQSICDCQFSDEGTERDEANAALIVRAVNSHADMLAALVQIATDCRARDYAERFTAEDAWNLISLIEKNARAAISKATGAAS